MSGMSRLAGGHLHLHFEDLRGPLADWITVVFGALPAASSVDAPTTTTIRLVDRLHAQKPAIEPIPISAWDGGYEVSDHLGRAARMTLPLSENEILVDREMDPWFFQRWVYFPVLKAALWEQRVALIHAAGVQFEGRRIAITGWAGAGKSPLLLSLLEAGADLIGDDWLALSEDGSVGPVSAQLNLNSWHRPFVRSGVWPGGRGRLATVRRAALRMSSLTRRHRKVSLGFQRAAEIASAAGKKKVALNDIYPGKQVGTWGRLDAICFLSLPGYEPPADRDVAESIAVSSRSELLYMEDVEHAIRFFHPRSVTDPLFGTMDDVSSVISSGCFGVPTLTIGAPKGVAPYRRLAHRLLDLSSSTSLGSAA